MINILLNKKTKTEVVLVFDNKLPEAVKPLKKTKLFSGKSGEVHADLSVKREGVIYLGLGSNKKLDNEELRNAGFKLGKALEANKVAKAHINFKDNKLAKDIIFHLTEGVLHSNYSFDRYKTKKENDEPVIELSYLGANKFEKLVTEATNLVNAVNIAKDFVNTPPIDLYPESYANAIFDLFKGTEVDVWVYDKPQIEDMGMKALLAVASGSDKDPRFVVLRYLPNKEQQEHLTFVGKGLTYDSGGYALKPANSMATMHSDMAGSAAVVGAIKAISDNKLPVNVVGVMALTENLINGSAYKNGDVISSMKGTSIEIGNTDAEGRVTLADSIYYAATKCNTTKIVELSTLTGACIVALGMEIIGSTTNNQTWFKEVQQAGERAGEMIWQLPVTESLTKMVKGELGDLKNSVSGGAGAITAGIFLEHFAEKKPFVHLDIAGPSWGKPRGYLSNGATGVGVRTLYEIAKKQ
ncbi:MAG: leucyl aminopeptidase [Acholeplasmataceae bacterium]